MPSINYYHNALADATSFANEQRNVKNFWGSRLKSTADYATPTPRRQRPAANSMTPSSAARPAAADTPLSAARTENAPLQRSPGFQYKPSPQRPLFQQPRYLLRELEANERHPTLTVVFDLDETLVSNRRADLPEALLRSFCVEALHAIRKLPNIEIVLWTASTEETGGPVVQQLERERGRIFDDVIFRNDIWFTEPMHTKDLRLLGRQMERVIVFDNAPNCVKLNRNNAILVDDYVGMDDPHDETLVNIFRLVQSLATSIEAGYAVPDILKQYSGESTNGCRTVYYALPEAWQHVNLRSLSPVMVPAHGKFIKIARQRVVA